MNNGFNEKILDLCLRDIHTARAMIIFAKDNKAALMMPIRAGYNGKNYRIWTGLTSKEEAKEIAKEQMNGSIRIELAFQEVKGDFPDNPEILLCNFFLIKFLLN